MPNPVIDLNGDLPPMWFFRLSCEDAITSTEQFGYLADDPVYCPGHGAVTVLRGETAEEVEARFVTT